jgi:hypothetical protein
MPGSVWNISKTKIASVGSVQGGNTTRPDRLPTLFLCALNYHTSIKTTYVTPLNLQTMYWSNDFQWSNNILWFIKHYGASILQNILSCTEWNSMMFVMEVLPNRLERNSVFMLTTDKNSIFFMLMNTTIVREFLSPYE